MNSSREAEERLTREQKRDHQTVKKIRAKGNHKKVFGDYNEAATAASAQTSFKKSKSIASKPVPKLKKVQPPSVEIAGAERTNLNPTAVDVKMETFDDSDDVLPRKIKKKGDLKCVREFDPRLIQENIRMGRYTVENNGLNCEKRARSPERDHDDSAPKFLFTTSMSANLTLEEQLHMVSNPSYSRKEKSLGLLCENFLRLYCNDEIEDVSLDVAASKLGSDAARRRGKSLARLSQLFVKLFLDEENIIIPLDLAAKELIQRDEGLGEIGGNVLKTKIRRLYDIANVLVSVGLIEKVLVPHCRKPLFRWFGGRFNPDVCGIRRWGDGDEAMMKEDDEAAAGVHKVPDRSKPYGGDGSMFASDTESDSDVYSRSTPRPTPQHQTAAAAPPPTMTGLKPRGGRIKDTARLSSLLVSAQGELISINTTSPQSVAEVGLACLRPHTLDHTPPKSTTTTSSCIAPSRESHTKPSSAA
ncbi:hypothetical protein DYB38_007100 [Aphanomyces astaci]|uniref:E2F/DP family winged-helix DNA-binding domain-containing protein n=2 Tax=Aphanomyces astaci TaxID=112090 RepID=A0A397E370_APHAT|nr:hypothetical protein DYB38_007100 [Aphanomyces astaci]